MATAVAADAPAIAFDENGATVEAAVIADGFGIDPETVAELIRQEKLTSRFERGVGADEGKSRLTFWIEGRRLRFVVDSHGNILQRFRIDFGGLPRR